MNLLLFAWDAYKRREERKRQKSLDLLASAWRLADAARPTMERLNPEWCEELERLRKEIHEHV